MSPMIVPIKQGQRKNEPKRPEIIGGQIGGGQDGPIAGDGGGQNNGRDFLADQKLNQAVLIKSLVGFKYINIMLSVSQKRIEHG